MSLIVGSQGFTLATIKVIPSLRDPRLLSQAGKQKETTPSCSIPLLLIMLGCPSGQHPIKNGSSLACVTKDKMADGSGFLSHLPCVVNKLLIFEGKWWVISDKNYGRGTRTILFEHHKTSIFL